MFTIPPSQLVDVFRYKFASGFIKILKGRSGGGTYIKSKAFVTQYAQGELWAIALITVGYVAKILH